MRRIEWSSVVVLSSLCALVACSPDGSADDQSSDIPGVSSKASGSAATSDGGGAKHNDGGVTVGPDGAVVGDDDDSDGGAGTWSDADPPPAVTRGANVPYWEYEAESATTTGSILTPSRTFGDVAAEASGRSAVKLTATGQKVEWKTAHATNSIVVRYSIPDAPGGGGATATIGLYVNGVRKTSLSLTSRYSWTYGDADAQNTGSENPSAGTPHHFYDEAHALIDDVPAGSTIALQRDGQDSAAYYVIDLVDFEEVAPPLPMPAGALSITDFGATPDDTSDDSAAIQSAIDAARTQGKALYIPRGTFETKSYVPNEKTPKLNVSGVTIRGAGMWHSVIHGFGAQFVVSGDNNRFYDFAVFGDITYRDDTKGWQGFDGPAGTGSRMENVWIEHETVGWWVGKGAFVGQVTKPLTDGLVVHGVRIRDTYADGVNFANATSNSTVEQSTFRNTGDDSIATWSFSADGPVPCTNNTFKFNTVQTVWRATCLALYGGNGHTIEDNLCADTSNYPGLLVSTTFSAIAFSGTTTVARNTLTRAGGPHYNQEFGALRVFADTASVTNVQLKDITIDSPTFSGVHFGGAQQSTGVTLDGIMVSNPGTLGIWVSSEAHGQAQANNVVVTGGPKGLQNDAPNAFNLQKGAGDVGW